MERRIVALADMPVGSKATITGVSPDSRGRKKFADVGIVPGEELLVEAPFDEIYLRWMEAMVDYHNGEIQSYNAGIILFNSVYEAFKAWYGRTHMPKVRAKRFFF